MRGKLESGSSRAGEAAAPVFGTHLALPTPAPTRVSLFLSNLQFMGS